MGEAKNIWFEVGNKCLKRASELLDSKDGSSFKNIQDAKTLVEIAIAIDDLNLRWATQTRYGGAAFQGRLFSPQEARN